jgi:hypothetical protein
MQTSLRIDKGSQSMNVLGTMNALSPSVLRAGVVALALHDDSFESREKAVARIYFAMTAARSEESSISLEILR